MAEHPILVHTLCSIGEAIIVSAKMASSMTYSYYVMYGQVYSYVANTGKGISHISMTYGA